MENPFELILQRLDNIEKILQEHASKEYTTFQKEDPDEIMTVELLSKYLTIARQTIYGKCSAREIPHFKTGKRLYFRKSEINDWINTGKIRTAVEIQKEAEEWIRKHPRKF